ncbi:MAG: DUF3084 domain-containing protein [Armatimonadetes bacterium]|nr:DUF3084 domain-containing protein [Armatimonadota bacterium]
MELASFGVVLLFCIVGAFLAYFADNLGRYLGKKRLSIFKLRPRHTATFLTCTAGFIIPLLTVGVLAAISREVRVILAEGSQLSGQRDKLRTDLITSKEEIRQSTLEGSKKDLELRQKQGEIKEAGTKLTKLTTELTGVKRTSGELKKQTESYRAQVANFRTQVSKLGSQASTLRREFELKKREFEGLNVSLKRVNAELQENNGNSQKLLLQQSQLEREIKQKERTIGELKTSEAQIKKAFDDSKLTYTNLLSALDGEKEKAEADLKKLQTEYTTLTEDIAQLQALSNSLGSNAASARVRPLIFNRYDELNRTRVGTGLTAEEARMHIDSALLVAEREAAKRGAKPAQGGKSVTLVEIPYKDQIKSPEEQMADAVRALTGQKQPQVIMVNAYFNSFLEEYVPVVLQIQPNPVIYKIGDVIAEQRIDGAQSEENILKQISDFLQDGVRKAAIRSKMIPARGKEEMLGELSTDRVLALVRQIRGTGRTLRVTAIASRETRAADNLSLDFRFR